MIEIILSLSNIVQLSGITTKGPNQPIKTEAAKKIEVDKIIDIIQ